MNDKEIKDKSKDDIKDINNNDTSIILENKDKENKKVFKPIKYENFCKLCIKC